MTVGEMELVDPKFRDALARLRSAMGKVANGDVSDIVAPHSSPDDVTGFYGWGGYEKGSEDVAARRNWAGQRFKESTVSYHNLACEAGDHLGYSVEIETIEARLNGQPERSRWSSRVTHIFRREQGEWRLIHRHASRLQDQGEATS